MSTFTYTTQPDPRCPYCGRPVIGAFVAGNEGWYHPACVQPPPPSIFRGAPYVPPGHHDNPYRVGGR